jgi:hypothetical protein
MTALFLILFSWGMVVAKSRRQAVSLAAAGAVAVMLIAPPQVRAQGSLVGAIQAVLNVINGVIKTSLNSINAVRSAISQFYQLTVWPQQLISQARALITQTIGRYRSQLASIFNLNLKSASLPATQRLETVIRDARTGDLGAVSSNYSAVYGAIPSTTTASAATRTLTDMDDALAEDTLKTLKESDDADNLMLGTADQIENAASQAAPGSAPFLTAASMAAAIESQALTQKLLAAELREEAAHLAHANTLRKQAAAFASQVSGSIQNSLQPQQ